MSWMVVLHRGDFNLSNFQDGVLSSAFMVGLLVASPIFASVAKRFWSLVFPNFLTTEASFC